MTAQTDHDYLRLVEEIKERSPSLLEMAHLVITRDVQRPKCWLPKIWWRRRNIHLVIKMWPFLHALGNLETWENQNLIYHLKGDAQVWLNMKQDFPTLTWIEFKDLINPEVEVFTSCPLLHLQINVKAHCPRVLISGTCVTHLYESKLQGPQEPKAQD